MISKFLPLLSANIRRKKMRSLLTLASFAVALFLFGLLAAIHAAFYQGIEVTGADRLVIRNRISLIMPLPVSYNERLLQIQGVSDATYATWFGGVYQTERNFFPQIGIESESFHKMFPEFIVPEDQWRNYMKDREGCLAGRKLVERFKWKIGDRIPLKGTIFGGVWEFNLCGIFDGKRQSDDTTQFWFHHKLLDESREWGTGMVGWYYVKVQNPDDASNIAKLIDERFVNSPYETTSETERAFATGFVKQFGNIKLIILSVGGVVFFTLLLITGSNLAISVRERTSEIAVLKTIGFQDYHVLFLIFSESLFYAIIGGGFGLAGCKLFTMMGDPTGGMLPLFFLPADAVILGAASAIAIGLLAGSIPAMIAMKLRIVQAMRRV